MLRGSLLDEQVFLSSPVLQRRTVNYLHGSLLGARLACHPSSSTAVAVRCFMRKQSKLDIVHAAHQRALDAHLSAMVFGEVWLGLSQC